jgi:hypothetical protein
VRDTQCLERLLDVAPCPVWLFGFPSICPSRSSFCRDCCANSVDDELSGSFVPITPPSCPAIRLALPTNGPERMSQSNGVFGQQHLYRRCHSAVPLAAWASSRVLLGTWPSYVQTLKGRCATEDAMLHTQIPWHAKNSLAHIRPATGFERGSRTHCSSRDESVADHYSVTLQRQPWAVQH